MRYFLNVNIYLVINCATPFCFPIAIKMSLQQSFFIRTVIYNSGPNRLLVRPTTASYRFVKHAHSKFDHIVPFSDRLVQWMECVNPNTDCQILSEWIRIDSYKKQQILDDKTFFILILLYFD